MDMNILKLILFSCESASKDFEHSEELANILKYQYFPLPEDIVKALSISFANLMCYKVSPQMHQRHAIQMRITETLRKCSKIEDVFGLLDTYYKNINVTSIAIKLFIENMTNKRLKQASLKTLIYLSEITTYLLHKDDQLVTCLNLIIIAIAKHPLVNESEEFLRNFLISKFVIHIDKIAIEIIYANHIKYLIEKPIIDDICKYMSNPPNSEYSFESCSKLLFRHIIQHPSIFHKACVILRLIFTQMNYDNSVLDFTLSFLKEIKSKCTDLQFLNLYPLRFQACVLLMKIEPCLHSDKSKNQLIELAKEISIANKDDLQILLMHFPHWLEIFATAIPIPSRGISLLAEL